VAAVLLAVPWGGSAAGLHAADKIDGGRWVFQGIGGWIS
jgi:hypothetical protein